MLNKLVTWVAFVTIVAVLGATFAQSSGAEVANLNQIQAEWWALLDGRVSLWATLHGVINLAMGLMIVALLIAAIDQIRGMVTRVLVKVFGAHGPLGVVIVLVALWGTSRFLA